MLFQLPCGMTTGNNSLPEANSNLCLILVPSKPEGSHCRTMVIVFGLRTLRSKNCNVTLLDEKGVVHICATPFLFDEGLTFLALTILFRKDISGSRRIFFRTNQWKHHFKRLLISHRYKSFLIQQFIFHLYIPQSYLITRNICITQLKIVPHDQTARLITGRDLYHQWC